MNYREFTSEAVTSGHPDKICDQIADAVVDRYMDTDPFSKCGVEVAVKNKNVFIFGEVKSDLKLNKADYEEIVGSVLRKTGYTDPKLGICDSNFRLRSFVGKQSSDINKAVTRRGESALGAGDQGIMFGYACRETPFNLPREFHIATMLAEGLERLRKTEELPYLRPDGKTQVSIRNGLMSSVVISAQHDPSASCRQVRKDLFRHLIDPFGFQKEADRILINPSGRFVIGGPVGDSGLTGRKLMCDTYGGRSRNGGGALSGKDPSKVDRSGAYMARNLALHILQAFAEAWGLQSVEIQLGYAIGYSEPVSLGILTEPEIEASKIDALSCAVHDTFDLSPSGIIDYLDLRHMKYFPTSVYGHFGRTGENSFSWEKISDDRVAELQKIMGIM